MQELLKLQQENIELTSQIDMIDQKIRSLKQNKGGPMDLGSLKETEETKAEEEVPQENIDLRKDVRKKQRELNALRKKWWAELKVRALPVCSPALAP